jgi:hypothetical protein
MERTGSRQGRAWWAPREADAAAIVDGFRRFVLAYGATRSWLWLRFSEEHDPLVLAVTATTLTGAAALAFVPRLAHHAPRLALLALGGQLVLTLPLTDNHFFLELLAVGVLAVVGPGGADAGLALAGLRALAAVVLFQTGLQKVMHGQYFGGEFLAYMIGLGGRFAEAFGLLVSSAELERLRGLQPLTEGAGPYRVAGPGSALFVLASNLVWAAELALPALLLHPRTRRVATVLACIFVLAIQVGAREGGFALLFSAQLLLFWPTPLLRRLIPFYLALFAVLLGTAFLGIDWLRPGWL